MLDSVLQDLRYALRQLRGSPAFTTVAVLTLALGIGANTAIFSVVNGVLLRPAPFPDLDRLAIVWETDRKSGTTREPASIPDYFDFQQRSTQFAALAALSGTEVNLTPDGGEPARLAAIGVSHEFVPLVGLRVLAGRAFSPDEGRPGGPSVILISEALATRLFDQPGRAVGNALRINEMPQTVIGVVPAGADFGALQVLKAAAYSRGFADRGGEVRVDVWLPLRPNPETQPRDNHPIFVLGRLADRATAATAQQEMTTITADLEAMYPANDARGAFVEPFADVVFGPVRPALFVLLGAVGLVLLVACVNVANLLLARGRTRMREVLVRTALGAGVGRLARQFLVESAVLATAGAIVGAVLALWGLELLLAIAPADVPRVTAVGLDPVVLGVTLGVTVLVALAFGLVPTLQVRRQDLQAGLHGAAERGSSAGREQRRFRTALVVSELALAVVLTVGAGLLIKSLWRLQQVDPGFDAAGVLKAQYQLPASRYPRNFAVWPRWLEAHRFNAELERRLAAAPGVASVAIAATHPIDAGFTSSISVVGREAEAGDWPEPSIRIVAASYFETLGVPLIAGRRFTTADDLLGAPVIAVNEAARRRFFEGREPLGAQINLWGAQRTVVAVIGNERIHGLDRETPPAVYLPLAQVPAANGSYSVLVRTRTDPATLAPLLHHAVHELDPALPLYGVEPLPETLAGSVGQRRFTMVVLAVFAGIALVLAAVGVHGVLSYTVAQRTREIGIQMALGARAQDVLRGVLRQGLTLSLAGIGIGLAGAAVATRVLRSQLYGVSHTDPASFVAVALVLVLVALVASYLPARRATRVEPITALRAE